MSLIIFFKDKESPSTSTAKSSRRDSLNERVMNHPSSSLEQEPAHHGPAVPIQSPPIHHMMQDASKQELPVRSAGSNR